LTIKIRTGWDPSGDQAIAIAQTAEASGVNAIAVHPRTAQQAFTGKADWSLIGRIKSSISIPVFGNGDINCAEDASRMMKETGCDAVMIGRAAIGNPFIFRQVLDRLAGIPEKSIAIEERFRMMTRYIDATCDYLGEKSACFMMRSKLGWFAKGLPQASQFRSSIRRIASRAEAKQLVAAYQKDTEKRFPGINPDA
jgi:nifR3 family TIM-barrel protein